MNKLLREKIKTICPNFKKIEYNDNSIIYTDINNKYVIKENKNNILELYNYLNSRGYNYIPDLVYCDKEVYVYKYLTNTNTPEPQKMSDLIKLDALLHNKTVYYKEISLDELKELYEMLQTKIEESFNYYDNIVTSIESNIYMSPSQYLLIRNCSAIFSCISFCRKELDNWYDIMKHNQRKRISIIHNNLDHNHLIKDDYDILISWDKALYDMPIYDFINLYKNNYNKYDFNFLYNEYIKRFPLLKEEKKLMFIILFIPDIIHFNETEITLSNKITNLCNYLYKTNELFMKNEAEDSKEQNHNINE